MHRTRQFRLAPDPAEVGLGAFSIVVLRVPSASAVLRYVDGLQGPLPYPQIP